MRKLLLGTIGLILLALQVSFAAPQQESLADAARKVREQKKGQPKATKVFTNDEVVRLRGHVSVVGTAAPAGKEAAGEEGQKGAKAGAEKGVKPEEEKKDEAYWRRRFTEARGRLQQAEKELDILQRELNLKEMQFYSDPNKALREQHDRTDIDNHRKAIEEKRAEVERLRQELSNLEDELRQSGGNPGWARPPE